MEEPTEDARVTYFGVSSERGLWETDPGAFQLRKSQITSITTLREHQARARKRPDVQPPRAVGNSAHDMAEPPSSPLLREQHTSSAHEEDQHYLPASSSPFIPATSLPPSSPPSSPLSMIFSELPDGRRSSSPFSESLDMDLDVDLHDFPDDDHMKGSPEQYPGEGLNDVPHDLQLPISPPTESPALSALDVFSDDLIITTIPLPAHDAPISPTGPISPAPATPEPPVATEEEVLPKRKAEELLDLQIQRKKLKTEIDNSPAPKAPKEKMSPFGTSSGTKRRTTGVHVLVKKVGADKLLATGRKTGVQVVTTTRRKPISKSSGPSNTSAKHSPPAASCSRAQPLPPRPTSPTQNRASGSKPAVIKRPHAPSNPVIKRPTTTPAVPSTSTKPFLVDVPPKASSSEPSLPEASSSRLVVPSKPSTSELSLVDVDPSASSPESSCTDVHLQVGSSRSASMDALEASSSRSVSVSDERETSKQPSKRFTKPKRAPAKRPKAPLTDDDSDSEVDTPPPPPPLPTTVDPELVGMLIETLATSRASSLPLSTAYKSLMSTRPGLKARHSGQEWMGTLSDVLEAGNGGVFGKVESSGKDASDRTLEARWFYNPEADADQERATLLRSMMPRPGKRAVTKRYKQYYYQPVATLTRWPGEEEAW